MCSACTAGWSCEQTQPTQRAGLLDPTNCQTQLPGSTARPETETLETCPGHTELRRGSLPGPCSATERVC